MPSATGEIEAQLERFEDHSNGDPPAAKSGRRRSKGNAPRFDVWTHLYRMTGVDLTQIDGVDAYTALKVVSEIGTDMTKWTSAKHFASWLGLSPNNRITGGKVISSKTKPSANRASAALRLAANALHRSDSALGAFLRRKKAQMGGRGAQGHYRHGPQAGQAHLHHAALWPGVRGCWCGTLRETVSAAGVARRQASGGPTGLPTGTNVRRRGPHHVRTSRRANRRVTTLVSGEQRYGRARAVQRRLTGQSASVISWLSVSTTIAALCPSKRRRLLLRPWRSSGVMHRYHPVPAHAVPGAHSIILARHVLYSNCPNNSAASAMLWHSALSSANSPAPACCLTSECYRHFSTLGRLQPAPIRAFLTIVYQVPDVLFFENDQNWR